MAPAKKRRKCHDDDSDDNDGTDDDDWDLPDWASASACSFSCDYLTLKTTWGLDDLHTSLLKMNPMETADQPFPI